MTLKTINLSDVEKLFAGNEFFEFKESLNFIDIKQKNRHGDHTLYKENIETIYVFEDLVDQIRIGFTMKSEAYLYFNLSNNYVSTSL